MGRLCCRQSCAASNIFCRHAEQRAIQSRHLRGMRDDGHRTEGIRHRLGKTIDTPHDCGQGQILRIEHGVRASSPTPQAHHLQEVVLLTVPLVAFAHARVLRFHSTHAILLKEQSQCLQAQPVL